MGKQKRIRSKSGQALALVLGPKLIVHVKDQQGNPVDGAKVIARSQETNDKIDAETRTLEKHPKYRKKGEIGGVAYFGGNVTPGEYSVYLDGWDPEDQAKAKTVTVGEKGHNRRNPHTTLVLETKTLRMYLDAERKGQIGDQRAADYTIWNWGLDQPGAVIVPRVQNS